MPCSAVRRRPERTPGVQLREGSTFDMAEPAEVVDFLRSRKIRRYNVAADRLHITTDGTGFFLQVMNGGVKEYPVRRAFVRKLFRWFSMPPRQLERLGMDTLASVLNDFLISIRSGEVTVKIEDGETLSITSSRYSEIQDLDILALVEHLNVERISRDDFLTRIYTRITSRAEPVPGDPCGLAYNILNSETGFQALSVQHFLLRYICSNGATIGSASRKESRVHFGYSKEALQAFVKAEIAFRLKESEKILDKLNKSVQRPAADSLDEVTERLGAVAGKKRARELLSDAGDSPSMFHIANLVSAFAQTLDIRNRLRLEHLAGELMLNDTFGHM